MEEAMPRLEGSIWGGVMGPGGGSTLCVHPVPVRGAAAAGSTDAVLGCGGVRHRISLGSVLRCWRRYGGGGGAMPPVPGLPRLSGGGSTAPPSSMGSRPAPRCGRALRQPSSLLLLLLPPPHPLPRSLPGSPSAGDFARAPLPASIINPWGRDRRHSRPPPHRPRSAMAAPAHFPFKKRGSLQAAGPAGEPPPPPPRPVSLCPRWEEGGGVGCALRECAHHRRGCAASAGGFLGRGRSRRCVPLPSPPHPQKGSEGWGWWWW